MSSRANLYDGVGNCTAETYTPIGGAAQSRSYTYPATSNKISNVMLGVAAERLVTHDNAGNIVTDVRSGTSYGYTYNNRNRPLTGLNLGSTGILPQPQRVRE